MLVEDQGHVNTLTVDGSWQRKGIATLLLLDLARAALGAGSRHLTLEVREHNDPAKSLYMKFGFAPSGSGATTTPRPVRTPSSCGHATATAANMRSASRRSKPALD